MLVAMLTFAGGICRRCGGGGICRRMVGICRRLSYEGWFCRRRGGSILRMWRDGSIHRVGGVAAFAVIGAFTGGSVVAFAVVGGVAFAVVGGTAFAVVGREGWHSQ